MTAISTYASNVKTDCQQTEKENTLLTREDNLKELERLWISMTDEDKHRLITYADQLNHRLPHA